MDDDFNPNAPETEEKCCPCCGFDPEEDKRKDKRLDELEAGAMAAILVELRAMRQLLIALVAAQPATKEMLKRLLSEAEFATPRLDRPQREQPRRTKSILDTPLPEWGRYEQHPMKPPLTLGNAKGRILF